MRLAVPLSWSRYVPAGILSYKSWTFFLSNYEYRLVFRNTTAHANADALSRLPLPEQPAKVFEEPELVLLAEHLNESPVSANDIKVWTHRDKKLARVLQYIQQGWPSDGILSWNLIRHVAWSFPAMRAVSCGEHV